MVHIENTIEVSKRLLSFVERYERLDFEKKALADDQKELLSEAKGAGFDTKVLREIIKIRATDPTALSEFESILQLYKDALGI